MLRSLAIAGALVALASAGTALAQQAAAPGSAQSGSWAYDDWEELMSPFCPGRTLASCPSPQAETLREWILAQEAAGRTKEDVNAELYQRFGDIILSAPIPRGFGLTAYAIPVAAFLLGGLVVGIFLLRRTKSSAERDAEAPPPEPLDPELERAIDEELDR